MLTPIQMKFQKINNKDPSLISSLNSHQTAASTLNDDKLNSVLDSIPPSSLVETNKSLLASSNMHLIPHVFYEPNQMETSCRYCHVEFKFNRLLRQHLRTMCNNNFSKKPFNCLLCNSGFTTKNLCVRHIEKSHPDYKKNNDNVQIQDLIIENTNINNSLDTKQFNGNLNTSGLTTAFTNSTTGSGSELLSNCDSSELDQPLNLANGFYDSLNKLASLSPEKYMGDDEFDDEDNQDALDLSVKSNERGNSTLDQLNTLNTLNQNSTNTTQLNDETMRNVISTLLTLHSIMPKQLNENQQLIAQANSLLNGQTINSNMNNLLAAQQLQNNNSTPSLLNLFNSFI